MELRIFGKELTNLHEQELRPKRNYSFMHQEKLQAQQKAPLTNRNNNRSLSDHQQKQEVKLEVTDPQMVPEYFSDNLQFLKSREKQSYRLTDYIPNHLTVSEQSRAKLIDWLSELHYKYKMFPETLFTVVSLIDQYLSVKEVPLFELQLVGVAALYIAAKFEETYQVPQVKQLVACCANQYTAQ